MGRLDFLFFSGCFATAPHNVYSILPEELNLLRHVSVLMSFMPPFQFVLEGRHILMSYPVFIELSMTRKTEKISRKIVVIQSCVVKTAQ